MSPIDVVGPGAARGLWMLDGKGLQLGERMVLGGGIQRSERLVTVTSWADSGITPDLKSRTLGPTWETDMVELPEDWAIWPEGLPH